MLYDTYANQLGPYDSPSTVVEPDVVLNIPIHTEITHTPTEVTYEVYIICSLIKY